MAEQPAPPAPAAPTPSVYHAGTMPDGRVILSATGDLPVDDTEVWFEDQPDARMTVVELEDANPVEPGTEIAWAAEPQPHTPGAAKSNPAKEPPMGMAAEMSARPPADDVDGDGEFEYDEVDEVPDMDELDVLDGADDEDRVAKTAGLTIAGEAPTGAMIALVPTDPDALVDPDGDPADALHVTLKWLGDAEMWDAEERELVENVVATWANEHTGSYKATVGGAGRLGKEGAAVLFLDVDDLQVSRSKLSAALYDAVGPDSEDTHPGFIPHLTTGYGTEPRYDLMGEPVWFDSVSVHWGPNVSAYPLNSDIAYIAATPAPNDDDMADEAPDEVEVDRMSDLVGEAEQRVGELEGMIAELVMAQVSDELFLDDDDPDPLPKVASLTDGDVVDYRAALDRFRGVAARLAALGDELPDDLAGRVDALMARLEALEGSVGEMMLDGVADEEMPELPPGSGTFIDETNPNRPGQDDEEDDDEEPDVDPDEDEDVEPTGDDKDDESDGPPWAKKKRKKGAKAAGTGLPLTLEAREKAAGEGYALPDGKLPIRTLVELRSAVKLRNNVKGHAAEAVKAHIVKRARALGATDELPEEWRD
jgi:hypothetical protein